MNDTWDDTPNIIDWLRETPTRMRVTAILALLFFPVLFILSAGNVLYEEGWFGMVPRFFRGAVRCLWTGRVTP